MARPVLRSDDALLATRNARRVKRSKFVPAAGGLALGLIVFSASSKGEPSESVQAMGANGVGIFTNGKLACWLSFELGTPRGRVSFVLARDRRICSIALLPRTLGRFTSQLQHRHETGPTPAGDSKCFTFQGRRYCE
jgi:hypothetical protein